MGLIRRIKLTSQSALVYFRAADGIKALQSRMVLVVY